jgi:hypothetical protein
MYERKRASPLHRKEFARRIALHLLAAVGVVAFSLGIGILGYHFLGKLEWLDAVLNACMILGGMGPVDRLATPEGKLFASFYALFSGLVFIALSGFLLAPFVHRLLHRFHWEED